MCLQITAEDLMKERMHTFVESIRNTGLILEEPEQYEPFNPHGHMPEDKGVPPVKPWTIIDE